MNSETAIAIAEELLPLPLVQFPAAPRAIETTGGGDGEPPAPAPFEHLFEILSALR